MAGNCLQKEGLLQNTTKEVIKYYTSHLVPHEKTKYFRVPGPKHIYVFRITQLKKYNNISD